MNPLESVITPLSRLAGGAAWGTPSFGPGRLPPLRKLGQRDLSSGKEEEGDRWESIAAASRSWTCWCLDNTYFEDSRQ